MEIGCLYIIEDLQSSLIKIGISNNWTLRLKSLKVGTKTKLKIVVKTEKNREWEKILHQEYADRRLVGTEWFSLDEALTEELLNKVEDIAKAYEAGREMQALQAIKNTKEQQEAADNIDNDRHEKTRKAFCLAYMRQKIALQWRKEGWISGSDFYVYSPEITKEAERLYGNGLRATSDGKWYSVEKDWVWIDQEKGLGASWNL
jgi:hypothetical protein